MSIEHKFATIVGLLKKARPGGDGRWNACCPAHDDETQSLSVKVGVKGAIVLKCHSPCRCSVSAIVAALGLTMADLFDNPDQHPRKASRKPMAEREFVTQYDYRTATGELAYQVLRFKNPKGFSQRRPNPKFNPKDRANFPEWVNNLEGVEPLLYKLPEFMAAVRTNPKRYIMVFEGEKDVDRAWKAGLVATTNSGGALKFRKEFAEYFTGLHVVIVPDNDPVNTSVGFSPGIRHAEEVAKILLAVAASVRVVQLPDVPLGGDFSDYWQAMEDANVDVSVRKERLMELIKRTPCVKEAPKEQVAKPSSAAAVPAAVAEPVKVREEPEEAAADLYRTGDALMDFLAYYIANRISLTPKDEISWFRNFQEDRIILESVVVRQHAKGDLRRIVFELCTRLIAGMNAPGW